MILAIFHFLELEMVKRKYKGKNKLCEKFYGTRYLQMGVSHA